ncbi:hypothetical protein CUMW_147220 [Citrus unshiu]|nr:hypothetical protein CUMW_147220 [Citrus unshiu]
MKKKIPCIVQWKPMASSRINFVEVYLFFNDESHLPNSKESVLESVMEQRDYAVNSLVFDDRLNCYLCGRQHTMSKSMTDVDMLLIPVNLDGAHWVLAQVDFRKKKV